MNQDEAASRPSLPEAGLVLDEPQPRARVYDECISVSGFVRATAAPKTLRVFCEEKCLGSTAIFGVQASDGQVHYHFRMLARFPEPTTSEREALLRFVIDRGTEQESINVGEVKVLLVPARLAERAYGDVVAPDRIDLLHRENIYGFGPPMEEPGEEMTRLILQFLPPASAVLDLGCGAGAYGPALMASGHRWHGAEVDPLCWKILARRGLPFQQLAANDARLPFQEAEFDAAIAIEVLEHVAELDALLAELARVTRTRLLVSVPNMEVIPYYAPLGVVPWHLLESTHVNFFTRASLRAVVARHFREVEVFSYAEPPVKTHDGIALHAHLFAIANR